jgi:hypothetical protein
MPPSQRLSFTDANTYLATAEAALNGWYTRQTTSTYCYVADAHVAITAIDQLVRELHRIRGALVGEIRADEDERAVCVDRLLAESRAHRAAQTPDIVGPAERGVL